MTGFRSRRRQRETASLGTTLTGIKDSVARRRTVAPALQRTYRSGLAGALAVVLVGALSAAATVDRDVDADQLARADLAALGLEIEPGPGTSVTAPDVEDWALEPMDFDVELEKADILTLREAEVAARNAERQALAEREAAADRAAAEQQAASQQQAEPQQRSSEQADSSSSSSSAGSSEPAPVAASQGGERGSLAGMVNSYRGSNGLSGLSRDGTLDQVAQNWAQWMASNQVLQHNPNYASQIGGGWSRSGENIVRNTGAQSWSSGDITSWMFGWWQNSAPHRANILNTAYTHVGVGYAMGSGGPYAVLLFGGR